MTGPAADPTPPAAPAEADQKPAPEVGKDADLAEQLLRLRADFENYRRRVEKEKADSRRWGKEEIILRLVSLMDVMEQAEAAAHTTPDLKVMVQGLDMLYKEFKRILKEEGLEEVPAPINGNYDHSLHEAVETVAGAEDGKILSVFQKGYTFQGGLFRPARVKVTRLATSESIEEPAQPAEK